MPLTVEAQTIIITSSLLAGLVTGTLFDIYRLIRGFNVPKAIVVIEDLLFWALAGISIFALLLYIDYAFLSTYVYIFIALALLLYLKFISPFVIKVERKIFDKTYKIIRIFTKIILYPIKVLYCIICGKNNSNKKIS